MALDELNSIGPHPLDMLVEVYNQGLEKYVFLGNKNKIQITFKAISKFPAAASYVSCWLLHVVGYNTN